MLSDISLHAFIQEHNIKNEQGDSLDFRKYRFMYDIYADRSPLICCMKAAQIGFTTFEILKTAHECRNEKIDIIYVLPTADDVKKFSGGKTNRILSQNPVMASWTKDKDSVEQKQFGDNTVYYQGSWTDRVALMITAKKLVVDEFDRCKQAVVEQFDSRLQSVANPKKAYFSNPSLEDFGIHKHYLKSDQKKWHITHSCGSKFIMDESCIDYQHGLYICPVCKGEITDTERIMGEWIATSVGEWSGYWIPLWIASWMPASKIAEAKREKSKEYFDNFIAGLPHALSENKISPETILKNTTADVNSQTGPIIIGVDTGLPIYFTVMNKEGVFYHGTCSPQNPYADLERLLLRWPQSIIVSDQGGDLIGIRQLQQKYPGRVFLVYYRKDRKSNEIAKWNDDGTVVVDRNAMIGLVIGQLRDTGKIKLNGTQEDWALFASHFGNIRRMKEETPFGMEYKWERNGPDHYVHALLYAMVGYDRFAEQEAMIISNDNWLEGLPRMSDNPSLTDFLP